MIAFFLRGGDYVLISGWTIHKVFITETLFSQESSKSIKVNIAEQFTQALILFGNYKPL